MCPSNSEQSSNPAMCSCLDNHVTSNEMITTTTEQCSGKRGGVQLESYFSLLFTKKSRNGVKAEEAGTT